MPVTFRHCDTLAMHVCTHCSLHADHVYAKFAACNTKLNRQSEALAGFTAACVCEVQILAEHRILSAPVTADGEVLGFVDIRDILADFLRGAYELEQPGCLCRSRHSRQNRNPGGADVSAFPRAHAPHPETNSLSLQMWRPRS